MDPATFHSIPPYTDRDRAYHERDRLEYELTVRQEPKQARMCGVGADRRPIDPPPIIQLRVIDPQTRQPPSPARLDADDSDPSYAHSFLQNPYYFMFASLAKPDDDTELHWLKDGKTRCTTGSVVSSLYHLKDTENRNEDAGFFVFPDLSVRTEGSYRLKLSLFEVVGNTVRHCKSIYSAPFYVYTAKKFPGMEESTPLSCSLADQGIKIRIRKDIRVRKRPIAALAAPIDTENNHNNEEDHENDTPLSAAPSSSGHSISKRPRHATVSSNGAPDLQTPTASLVGLPAWPSTSLDPMLGAPSAPGGVELPSPTHPPPPAVGIPPPRSASYETTRIPPPPGAQMIPGAAYENPRNVQPIQPATSQRQAQAMPPPSPFSTSTPVFNSQSRVNYEPPRSSAFDTRTAYENQRAPFERGYEQAERGYESSRPAPAFERAPFDTPRNTTYASGYEGQNASANATAFQQEPYPSYSSQPSTSNPFPHPSSPASSSASSAYPPSSRFGGSAYPYSQAQSRYEYPNGSQAQQQFANPNGDSYYDSPTSGPEPSSQSHAQPSYYPSTQSSSPTNSWSGTSTSANAQSYSSSGTHTQSYEYNHPQQHPQAYPNSEYYQHPHHQPGSSQGQGHGARVSSPAAPTPAPSRYANANATQAYSSSGGSNEAPYARPHPAYTHPPSSSSQHHQHPHHEWPGPASAWNPNSGTSVGDQGQGLIQLAPLRRHPSLSTSARHQHHHASGSSGSPSSSDASSPVGGTPVVGTSLAGGGVGVGVGVGVGAGGGGVIQLPRAPPFEHDARVQGKKNVLSIGSIISGV